MGYKILITAPTLADRAMAMLDALEATVFTIPDGAPDSLIYDIAARE